MGALVALGAVGVTLTYSILRFANFAHGEFIAWGTYMALTLAGALTFMLGGESGTERQPRVYAGSYAEYVQALGHDAPGIYS